MRKVSEATFVDFGLVGSKGEALCHTPMYKRLIFRYRSVLTKTQRNDKGGCVCGLIRRPLSFNVVMIGKSVVTFNNRSE